MARSATLRHGAKYFYVIFFLKKQMEK